MPSNSRSTTRRRLLAGLGTGSAVALAGCAGQLPGTSPRSVDATETGGSGELHWRYPEADGDSDGIGYASVTFEGKRSDSRTPSSIQFGLSTTVGGLAASEAYSEYEADWARFRLGPPAGYSTQQQFRMWVRPPTWPELRTRYEHRGGRRELVTELPAIDSGGTITYGVVFDPVKSLPDRIHCSFTVQASAPGTLGETVRASGQGNIDLAAVHSS